MPASERRLVIDIDKPARTATLHRLSVGIWPAARPTKPHGHLGREGGWVTDLDLVPTSFAFRACDCVVRESA